MKDDRAYLHTAPITNLPIRVFTDVETIDEKADLSVVERSSDIRWCLEIEDYSWQFES